MMGLNDWSSTHLGARVSTQEIAAGLLTYAGSRPEEGWVVMV